MADGSSVGSASTSNVAGGNGEEIIHINIKTLDSQIFTFSVDKKKPVSLLKENIANAVGVTPAQQRLIFRGKVLKDPHLLSEYHVEDGDTLHLVARQPVETQGQNSAGSDEAGTTGNQGNDATGPVPRARIGHSVVLGLNVSDQGENNPVDLSRIIGSVLNSFGIGTPVNTWMTTNASSTNASNMQAQASQNVTAGSQSSNGSNSTGNQTSQLPLPGALLHHMVIPDSLTTLSAFISRMEQLLSLHSGYQSPPVSNAEDPSSSLRPPSLDALIAVLERAQRLLSGPAAAAISHLLGRLERERGSMELSVRGQIQAEAMHVGVTMQHLGSLLLELGRTISTLRMGESSVESMVNAGPAIYVSASGPNPLMVQPVPHQTTPPLFAVPFPSVINVGVPEVIGLGDGSRNINIHMRATGTSAASGGTFVGSGASTTGASVVQPYSQGTSMQNSNYSHSSLATTNAQDSSIQQPPSGSSSTCETVAEINALARSLAADAQGDVSDPYQQTTRMQSAPAKVCDSTLSHISDTSISGVEEKKNHHDSGAVKQEASMSSLPERDSSRLVVDLSMNSSGFSQSKESCVPAPLGLGLGGLQPKRRSRSISQAKDTEVRDDTAGGEREQLIAKGQEILQSLASHSSKMRSDRDGNLVRSSSNNVVGSPAGFRSSQQVRGQNQNLGGMLSGIIQQMMPVVSQAFGVDSSHMSNVVSGPQPPKNESKDGRSDMLDGRDLQIGLQHAVQGIEHGDPPASIFRSMLDAASQLYGGSHTDLLETLSSDEELINEFTEMMRRQLDRCFQSRSNPPDKMA